MRFQKTVFIGALVAVGLTTILLATITPDYFTAVLAPGESAYETKTVYVPPVPPKADVVFAFDLTGSMGGIIGTAKANAVNILNDLNAIAGVDIQFGVMSYMDYPGYYTSCGYSATYGSAASGDYAYSLDQAVTDDTTAVVNAINGLVLGYGGDGPQDYTRIFYESYAYSNVGWRTGAKKILVNFGDNVPHDCDLNEGVMGGIWSTGTDPGRDEIGNNTDDLDLQTVLEDMADAGVVLLEAHTTIYANAHWAYWTGLTGGDVFITSSATLVDDICDAVTAALGPVNIYGLHLEASMGHETWLSSSPVSVDTPPDSTVYFDVTFTVPDGTPPGIYNFTVSALDEVDVNYGDQDVTIVVYDPSAGFVTGGGWIDSPAGAFKPDPSLVGKANFGFVSKYQKGATVPTGQTEFQFRVADLNFHSDSYEWLLVTGANTAMFKGDGTINGEYDPNGYSFKFIIWADDGSPDTFRIKIWWEDGAVENVVYDNGFKQAIAGGSIVIHTKK